MRQILSDSLSALSAEKELDLIHTHSANGLKVVHVGGTNQILGQSV